MTTFSTRWLVLGAAVGLSILAGVLALPAAHQAQATAAAVTQDCAPIGVATMSDDSTLRLRLRAEGPGGRVGEGFFVYAPDHARYSAILAHVGPIAPGETQPVRPFLPECS